jgi:hypothetical protein
MAGTRWVRLDVDYFRNPKTLAAGRDGRDLHLASICWVGAQLTDGVIPGAAVPMICRDAGVDGQAVGLAVAAGLWTPNGGASYELHDFINMNGSRADVEREREAWRERQRRARASRRDRGVTDA